jgi:hypothetical protein
LGGSDSSVVDEGTGVGLGVGFGVGVGVGFGVDLGVDFGGVEVGFGFPGGGGGNPPSQATSWRFCFSTPQETLKLGGP